MAPHPPVAPGQTWAIIMAGGTGTRFWPASRRARPKQYLPIAGDAPMLTQTAARLSGLVPLERVLVVTTEEQRAAVEACLPELPRGNLIAEPTGRNTAACTALAALEVARRDPQAGLFVLPADHVIEPAERFRATLAAGLAEARAHGTLVTFGIQPTSPATGYGYIELGDALAVLQGQAVHAVKRFVEKPDRARAEAFLETGRFLWNAGIFAFTAEAILAAFRRHAPGILAALEPVVGDPARLAAAYGRVESVPIDVAIFEKAENVRTLRIDYRWNDVGSWSALAEIGHPDAGGNYKALGPLAKLIAEESRGNVVYSEGDDLIALVGVQDLVVVRSGRVTLVCSRERAQDVKRIVERLGAAPGGAEFL